LDFFETKKTKNSRFASKEHFQAKKFGLLIILLY